MSSSSNPQWSSSENPYLSETPVVRLRAQEVLWEHDAPLYTGTSDENATPNIYSDLSSNPEQNVPLITMLTFYAVFYAGLMILLWISYPVVHTEAFTNFLNLIFPIAAGNSLTKTLLVTSAFYWGMVAITMVHQRLKAHQE